MFGLEFRLDWDFTAKGSENALLSFHEQNAAEKCCTNQQQQKHQ